jgi:CO dehydrogenase/acetyl-CoA synthase alpha subunit
MTVDPFTDQTGGFLKRKKPVVVIDLTMVIAACEIAARVAYEAEVTRQVSEQLPPGQRFVMTYSNVTITEIGDCEITCPSLDFEWR